MTTSNRFSMAPRLIAAGFAVSGLLAVALPSFAYAADYAFVNTSGEVSVVTASSPAQALLTAVNISLHSGVMLLINQTDGIVGDIVGGV